MRAAKNLRLSASKWAVIAIAALMALVSARADHPPLPPGEQSDVNTAVDLGVHFLKHAQLPSGTWAEGANSVGYAALPGLTLLECGVATDDKVIRQAAAFVRRAAQNPEHPTERTYDLALTILFLDKLGDHNDDSLIRTLALRLVAGQSQTGGWGYKCPVISGQQTHDLLNVLHHIAPGPSPIPMKGEAVVVPAGGGKLAGQPAVNPGALAGGPAANGPGLAGTPGVNPASPGDGAKSPGDTNPSPGAVLGLPNDPTATDKGMLALQGREESIGSRHWAWCIKAEEDDTPDAAPPSQPSGKPKPPAAPAGPPEPLRIPADLQQLKLTVLQDFSKLQMLDPQDQTEGLVYATTDNSNTQFAILALWVAQRHDVPMERTLRLVANRFQTSQGPDGSWSYRFAAGGAGAGEVPAMDCVGLLGLAVGQGIAQAGQGAVNAGPDPAILKGFAALSRHIGDPVGRTHDLPLVNMYMLWSIERVSVLYGLPRIANKDWYKWGAEVLVANQSVNGDWPADGGYPGQTPLANTCLALLFLRKANLVSDLTAALPFQPEQLNASITDTITPKPTPPPSVAPPTPKPPADPPAPPTEAPTTPPQTTAPTGASSTPQSNLSVSPSTPAAAKTEPEESGGGRLWLILVLALVAVVLLGASGTVLFVHLRNRNKTAKVSKKGHGHKTAPKRAGVPLTPHPSGERAKREGTAGPETKKPSGKSRLRS